MSAFLPLLVAAALHAAVLAALVLLIQWALRRQMPARWRFALWMLVLVRLSMVPLPESRLSVFNWLPEAARPAAPVHAEIVPEEETVAPVRSPKLAALPASRAFSWWPAAEGIYFSGAALVLLRMAVATLGLRRIVRGAERVSDRLALDSLAAAKRVLRVRRAVPLLTTERLKSPALVGWLHPQLLVPRALLESLAPHDLQFVFLHECAHLRRNDVLLNYWLAALGVLHWFNPVYWLLLPRIRADRELACDELVMLHTPDPAPYGQTLLRLIECGGGRGWRRLARALSESSKHDLFLRGGFT